MTRNVEKTNYDNNSKHKHEKRVSSMLVAIDKKLLHSMR